MIASIATPFQKPQPTAPPKVKHCHSSFPFAGSTQRGKLKRRGPCRAHLEAAVIDIKGDELWWIEPRLADWSAPLQLTTLCRTRKREGRMAVFYLWWCRRLRLLKGSRYGSNHRTVLRTGCPQGRCGRVCIGRRAGGKGTQGDPHLWNNNNATGTAAGLASPSRLHAHRHGIDGCVLGACVCRVRGPL